MDIRIINADERHVQFAEDICNMMADAAKQRGTGIAKRTPDYIQEKIQEGKAVIALKNNKVAGFCYIETWGHGKYVANSGLIVNPEFRGSGLAKKIKEQIFQLSLKKFPNAKIFGITTSLAVMKINSDLGYKPVTFSELTNDEAFWKGCQSCKNYDILTRTDRSHCLCTGMLHDPNQTSKAKKKRTKEERWQRFKKRLSFKSGDDIKMLFLSKLKKAKLKIERL